LFYVTCYKVSRCQKRNTKRFPTFSPVMRQVERMQRIRAPGLEDPTPLIVFATTFLKTDNFSLTACHLWPISAVSSRYYPATFLAIFIVNSNLSWNEQSSFSGIWPIKPYRCINLSQIVSITLGIRRSATNFTNYLNNGSPKSTLRFVHRTISLSYQERNHALMPIVTGLISCQKFQPLCGRLVPLNSSFPWVDPLVFA
jgi:hypothetical protein